MISMKQNTVKPEFVEFIPDYLQEGILYISLEYSTATHKCFCGCGEKVVTPIRPTEWTLTRNENVVSLNPSIGSFSLPCKSHYFIKENKIQWL